MDLLQQIITTKRQEIAAAKKLRPPKVLQSLIPSNSSGRNHMRKKNKMQLIAEIKAKSPSKGIIRPKFNPVELAKEFENSGANAISVLTDETYFGGSLQVLEQIRFTTQLPLLRKDFLIDPYQLLETKAYGADIVLLIARILDDNLPTFLAISQELGLQPLIEVHTQAELTQVLKQVKPNETIMVGVNNRDLNSFATDMNISLQLAEHIPAPFIKVSESGIHGQATLKLLAQAGFDAVLIGEGLAQNPTLTTFLQ